MRRWKVVSLVVVWCEIRDSRFQLLWYQFILELHRLVDNILVLNVELFVHDAKGFGEVLVLKWDCGDGADFSCFGLEFWGRLQSRLDLDIPHRVIYAIIGPRSIHIGCRVGALLWLGWVPWSIMPLFLVLARILLGLWFVLSHDLEAVFFLDFVNTALMVKRIVQFASFLIFNTVNFVKLLVRIYFLAAESFDSVIPFKHLLLLEFCLFLGRIHVNIVLWLDLDEHLTRVHRKWRFRSFLAEKPALMDLHSLVNFLVNHEFHFALNVRVQLVED